MPRECVVFGEIALSGEMRPVAHAGLRLKEAAKLGFESAWVPKGIKGAHGLRVAEFVNLARLGRPGARTIVQAWPLFTQAEQLHEGRLRRGEAAAEIVELRDEQVRHEAHCRIGLEQHNFPGGR